MKREEILDAMNYLDDDIIRSAEEARSTSKRPA